ncbi:histone-lysine N-methyltransferase SETMAR-like [Vespa mandarinia]|uniref:histone-lysine N-methyltransferase SETMAR-like n=1 Tax=Vespa mandarinia TaxID=7446 RepID=UPI0016124F66|nr:histone-lysine N-methyltransferase SETMAR-like [Vespa mandarinia]
MGNRSNSNIEILQRSQSKTLQNICNAPCIRSDDISRTDLLGSIILGCSETRKKLTDVYGEDVLTVRQCQNWFAKFRYGNFDVEDAPRSGRLVEADKDTIKALVDANQRITIREIGERLNLSNSTVYDHLKGLGLTSKLDIWVPHVLTERNLCRRVDVCDSFLKRHENDPFLKRIITEDEKWIVYNNVKRKRSWSKKDEPAQSISKANIHQRKIILSIWWDFKGIVFLGFYRITQQLIRKSTVISWTN